MIEVCICDDEKNILKELRENINKISSELKISVNIREYNSGEELIFDLDRDFNTFKILLIDIVMKSLSGIETARLLRKNGYEGEIIFLTSSEEYALEAFEVEAFNYIVKSGTIPTKFHNIFTKALNKVKEDKKKIIINKKEHKKIIDINNIVYLESNGKKLLIHKIENEEEIYESLTSFYEKIENFGFIRCHKSFVINSRFINSFNNNECILNNNVTIPIGRKYGGYFKEKYIENEFNNLKF